jgi:hypothetical protein
VFRCAGRLDGTVAIAQTTGPGAMMTGSAMSRCDVTVVAMMTAMIGGGTMRMMVATAEAAAPSRAAALALAATLSC